MNMMPHNLLITILGLVVAAGVTANEETRNRILKGKPTPPPSPSPTHAPSTPPTPYPTHAPTKPPTDSPTVSASTCEALTSILWAPFDGGVNCAAPCCLDDGNGVFTFPLTVTVEDKIDIRSTNLIHQLHFPILESCGISKMNDLENLKEVTLPNLKRAKALQFNRNPMLAGIDLPSLQEISTPEEDNNIDAELRVQGNAALSHINAPKLTTIESYGVNANANLYIWGNDMLSTFTFDFLSKMYADDGGEAFLYIRENAELVDFFFPRLQSIIGQAYYGALLIDGNDMLTNFEFPSLSDIGPDDYAEFSVSGNDMLTKVEMPALRTVNYIFFSGTRSLVEIRLPRWEGGGSCSYLDFYGGDEICADGEDLVIRLCSLRSLEYDISFFGGGDCYKVRGTEFAEAQCNAIFPSCTIYDENPPNC